MANNTRGSVLRQIHAIYSVGTFAGLSDGQLLDRFTAQSGEPAELAFAALVERHGPMVYRVCRRLLLDSHDAQDAFQATFLVLVRKARTLRDRGTVGNWLYGVASRIALQNRAAIALRHRREAQYHARTSEATTVESLDREEWNIALHEELRRLPERYREPVVLCHLEGLSHEEAALRLGRPVGTVRSRLARGRERLRGKLTRRGISPSDSAIATLLSNHASGAMPQSLFDLAVASAVRSLAGRTAVGTASAAVTQLVQGELRNMFMTRLKFVAIALTTVGTIATGAGAIAYQDAAGTIDPATSAPAKTSAQTLPRRAAAIGEYLEKTKKEVDAAVNDLRAEVADLRAKLAEAETNLRRLEALQGSLGGQETLDRYGRTTTNWPVESKYTTKTPLAGQSNTFQGLFSQTEKQSATKPSRGQRTRESIDQEIKRLTDERNRLDGVIIETPK